jgi:hypothetical protein
VAFRSFETKPELADVSPTSPIRILSAVLSACPPFCPFVLLSAEFLADKRTKLYMEYRLTYIFNTILSADNPRTTRTKRYISIRVHIDLILFCPRTITYDAYVFIYI